MAIDLAAIRKKLDVISGNKTYKNVTWKPEEGKEYTVRLLAYPNNDGQPFKELWFYYNVGSNPPLLTLKQFNEPDPVQELIEKLRKDESKEGYELAKKLYPKMRCYAPIIVRGEEDKGVRLWGFGKEVYQKLLNFMLDEDYGDITDVKEGKDIKLTCAKAPGKMFASVDIRPRAKSTPLHEDKEMVKKFLDSVPDTSDMYPKRTYDELAKIISDWLNSSEDSDDTKESPRESSEPVKEREEKVTTRGKSETQSSKSKTDFDSLDDAFNSLTDDDLS